MTKFMYENGKELQRMGKGLNGSTVVELSKGYIKLLMYIISYAIYTDEPILIRSYEQVKTENFEKDIRIFFEKVKYCSEDVIYFQNWMKKLEKDSEFQLQYNSYLTEVLAA